MEMSTDIGVSLPFVCGLCKDAFGSIVYYYKHFKSHNVYINKSFHICDSSETQEDDNMISCKSCCSRFTTICLLHEHLTIGCKDGSYIYDDEEKVAYPLSMLCALMSSREDEVTEGENYAIETSTKPITKTLVASRIKVFKTKEKINRWLNSDLDKVKEENIKKNAICDVATADMGEEDQSIVKKDANIYPKRDRICKKLKKVESNRNNLVINADIKRVSNRKASSGMSSGSDIITRHNKRNSKKQNFDIKVSQKKESVTKATLKRKHSDINGSVKAKKKKGYSVPGTANISDHIKEKTEDSLPCDAGCIGIETDDDASMTAEMVESNCDADNDDSIENDISDSADEELCEHTKFSEIMDMPKTNVRDKTITKAKQKSNINLKKQNKQSIKTIKEKKIETVDESQTDAFEHTENNNEKKKNGKTKFGHLMNEVQTLKEERTLNTTANIDESAESETTNTEHSVTDQKKKKHGRKDRDLVTCEVCGKAVRQNKVKVHAISHSDDRPYQCQRCPKTYKYPEHLAMHVKSHDDVLPFYCEVCGQGFIDVNRLKRHAFMHTTDRPFHCTVCDSGFVTRYKLERHMQVHTREKKMQCDLCGMRFAHKDSLNQHISSIHRKEHRFPCPECNKSFFTNYQLKCHTMKHSGLRPFKCSHCKSDFIERKELRRHMRKQHKLDLEGKDIEPVEPVDTGTSQTAESEFKSENPQLEAMPLLQQRPELSTLSGNLERDLHSVSHQANPTRVQCEVKEENLQKNHSVTVVAANGSIGSHVDPREVGSQINIDGSSARVYDKDKPEARTFDSQLKPFNFDSQVGDTYPGKEHQNYPPCVDQKVTVYPVGPCFMHQPPPEMYLPMYPNQLRPPGYEALDPGSHCKDVPMYTMPGLRPAGLCDSSQVTMPKDKQSYLENHSAASISHSQGDGSNFTML